MGKCQQNECRDALFWSENQSFWSPGEALGELAVSSGQIAVKHIATLWELNTSTRIAVAGPKTPGDSGGAQGPLQKCAEKNISGFLGFPGSVVLERFGESPLCSS